MKSTLKILTWLMAFLPLTAWAQNIEMASAWHENGKIYVVIGVIAIIFIGLVIYLISLDRRLTKIEKEEKTHTP